MHIFFISVKSESVRFEESAETDLIEEPTIRPESWATTEADQTRSNKTSRCHWPNCKRFTDVPCSTNACTTIACKSHSAILCVNCMSLLSDKTLPLQVTEGDSCLINCQIRGCWSSSKFGCNHTACKQIVCRSHRGKFCYNCVKLTESYEKEKETECERPKKNSDVEKKDFIEEDEMKGSEGQFEIVGLLY